MDTPITDEDLPEVRVEALRPGDRIVIDAPCFVTVTKIEAVPGTATAGNRVITYADPELVYGDPHVRLGQKVTVPTRRRAVR
jgi:hypothetical protein